MIFFFLVNDVLDFDLEVNLNHLHTHTHTHTIKIINILPKGSFGYRSQSSLSKNYVSFFHCIY